MKKRTIVKSLDLFSLEEREATIKETIENYNVDENEALNIIQSEIFDNLCDLIHCNDYGTHKILVKGTLGLWNGKKSVKTTFKTFKLAIRACLNSGDDGEIYVDEETNNFHVDVYHHDGVNEFILTYVNGKPLLA